jgi:Zn-dependent peptidase ImmA (M78 family)
MPRATLVPINGAVLEWAIRESGYTESDVAEKLGVPAAEIMDWERGQGQPSKTKFARLVEVLKRPSAVFFLPSPPPPNPVQAQFRKGVGVEARPLNVEEARWLRRARRLQRMLAWIRQEQRLPPVDIARASIEEKPQLVAARERERFEVSLAEQKSWQDVYMAAKRWRWKIEERGVAVFHARLGRESCRGFSLWDDYLPIVAANSTYNTPARIFAYFHEFARLLLRSDSVCGAVSPDSPSKVEGWCELFAAAFLMPGDSVAEQLRNGLKWTGDRPLAFEDVGKLGRVFSVSLRAVALRLRDLGLASEELYEEVDRRAVIADQEKSSDGGGTGASRPEIRVRELGWHVPAILLAAMHQDLVGLHDVMDLLNASASDVDDLELMLG